MAVCGEWIPARALACGSISLSRRASIIATPGTPLATPRSYRALSRGSSSCEVATMTLPQVSTSIPFFSQYAFMRRAPSTQSRAL